MKLEALQTSSFFNERKSFSVGNLHGDLVLKWFPRGHYSSLRHYGIYLLNPLWHLVAQSCLTLRDPHGLQSTSLLCPWDSPGKNTGVGCHALLQGIFPTQGSNPGLQHCREILYHLSHQESPHFTVTGQWWLHTSSRALKLLKKIQDSNSFYDTRKLNPRWKQWLEEAKTCDVFVRWSTNGSFNEQANDLL